MSNSINQGAFGMPLGKTHPDSFMTRFAKDAQKRMEAETRALANAKADQEAVWSLADLYLPNDVLDFGKRHDIPVLSEFIWRSAFVAGWRAAMRAKPVHTELWDAERKDVIP